MKLENRLKKLESRVNSEKNIPIQWLKVGYWGEYEKDKYVMYIEDQCIRLGGRGDEETPKLKLTFVYLSEKLSTAQLDKLKNYCESEEYTKHEKYYFDITNPAPELLNNENIQCCLREFLNRGGANERIKILIQ